MTLCGDSHPSGCWPRIPSPSLAPVCDLILVPLGLSGKEVVVGHIRVAAAWLPHGLNSVLVQVTCLGQPKELLHLLEGVLQHKEVATLLGAAIESIQVLLKETGSLKVRNHIEMAKYTAPPTPPKYPLPGTGWNQRVQGH